MEARLSEGRAASTCRYLTALLWLRLQGRKTSWGGRVYKSERKDWTVVGCAKKEET